MVEINKINQFITSKNTLEAILCMQFDNVDFVQKMQIILSLSFMSKDFQIIPHSDSKMLQWCQVYEWYQSLHTWFIQSIVRVAPSCMSFYIESCLSPFVVFITSKLELLSDEGDNNEERKIVKLIVSYFILIFEFVIKYLYYLLHVL